MGHAYRFAVQFWAWATMYLQAYHLPFLIACRLGYNYVTDPKAKALGVVRLCAWNDGRLAVVPEGLIDLA